MELDGKIEHFTFLLDAFAYVLQLEVWLDVQKGLYIVQEGHAIEVRIEEHNICSKAETDITIGITIIQIRIVLAYQVRISFKPY